jgi:membrane-bound serine protease (ClpP class)
LRERSTLPGRLAFACLALSTLLLLGSGSAMAQSAENPDAGFVVVFEVSGLLDPIMADALEDVVHASQQDGARALVLQVDSEQAVVSDERLNQLARTFVDASVPIAVWVGPSGSSAHGKVAQLVSLADHVGVAIGSTIGATGEQVLDPDEFGIVWGERSALLADTELDWKQAVEFEIVDCELLSVDELGNQLTEEQSFGRCANPTTGDFLVGLDVVDTRVVYIDGQPRRSLLTPPVFTGIGLLDQLMHTVASPPIAYLLTVIGLALLVFEFYSIGIGVAGVIGAVMGALGAYGLAVLPFRTWALVLLVLSMVAFSIDVQTAVPRAWTIIGMVLFIAGTVFLYPESDVAMSWIPMVVAIVGMAVVMGRGMPIMVRGRFATTEVSRSFLIGEPGVIVAGGDEGLEVEVLGVRWPATAPETATFGVEVMVTDSSEIALSVAPRG